MDDWFDFYDPPVPLSGQASVAGTGLRKGRKAPRVGFLTKASKPKKPAKRKGTTKGY